MRIKLQGGIDIGHVYEIGGRHYTVELINESAGIAEIEEISMSQSGSDIEDEEFITCPYCCYENGYSCELPDAKDDQACEICGGAFSYRRHVVITYTSSPVRRPKIKKLVPELAG